jgi:cytosine/adenosine deaminase-related metal-dependent hydrolase
LGAREATVAIDRILLKGGCILTLDPDIGNYRQGDLLIEGTKITSVGPRLRVADAEVIDASNMIVMPGFIDTHRHIWEGILKNIAPDALLDEYFRDILGVLAPAYRAQDAYAGNLVSALGAIDAGVTTLLDWSHIQNTPEHTDAAIAALQESGLRAVFAYGTPNLDMPAWWHESTLEHPHDVKRVAKQYFSSGDQLLTLALAPRGPEFTTFEVSKRDWALARDVGIRINMRLDQRRLNALARAWQSRAANRSTGSTDSAGAGDETLFELEVRNEIDSILTEIERP